MWCTEIKVHSWLRCRLLDNWDPSILGRCYGTQMYKKCYWFVLYHCRAKKVKRARYQTMILLGKLIALSGTWLYLHTAKFIALHCAFCRVQRDFGFCPFNHLSGGRVNVNHIAMHLHSLAHKNKTDMKLKMNLDHSRIIAKEITIVSAIFVKGRSLPCENFIITQVVFAKTVSNSPNPPSVYIRLRKHAKHFLLLNCNWWHRCRWTSTP